jgi:cellulose synthase/poly-beta-1,6-N-acetylglucosamine synthase-like glycosyltransferase
LNLAIAVFAVASAFVVWVLFGYPVLLGLLARLRPGSPVRKRFCLKPVSILLPVANGERYMRRKLESLLALDYPRELVEIIVASDGSTDRTCSIVEEFDVRLLRLPKSGKAVALNRLVEEARGEVLFFTDVRQPVAPESLKHLVACLQDPTVGAATGELFIRRGESDEEANVGLYWRYEKWIRRRLSALDSILGATGCIWAMRRDLVVPLPAGTLLDDVYQPLNVFFRGYRVVMEETARAWDDPTPLKGEFRRKVRTQAGMYQILRAYPQLLGPANRMWLHFVSHKVGRLLLPFALIAIAVSSVWLPHPWNLVVGTAQAAVYGLAVLDLAVPDGMVLKRVTAPLRAFFVLVLAALCAVAVFFVPADRLWQPDQGRSG